MVWQQHSPYTTMSLTHPWKPTDLMKLTKRFYLSKNLLVEVDMEDVTLNTVGGDSGQNKCQLTPTQTFSDYILTESSGIYQRSKSNDDYCKEMYVEILDTVMPEMENRFFNNSTLFNLIHKLKELHKQKKAFIATYNSYAVTITFG